MNTATSAGYYNPQIAPEPDSILSAAWGVAVALGLRRIFCGGTTVGTLSTSPNPLVFTFPNVSVYSKTPFVKIYTHYGSGIGRVYGDYFSQGSSAISLHYVNLSFVDKSDPTAVDKATVYFSGSIPGAEGFTIIAHGR